MQKKNTILTPCLGTLLNDPPWNSLGTSCPHFREHKVNFGYPGTSLESNSRVALVQVFFFKGHLSKMQNMIYITTSSSTPKILTCSWAGQRYWCGGGWGMENGFMEIDRGYCRQQVITGYHNRRSSRRRTTSTSHHYKSNTCLQPGLKLTFLPNRGPL